MRRLSIIFKYNSKINKYYVMDDNTTDGLSICNIHVCVIVLCIFNEKNIRINIYYQFYNICRY